MSAIESAFYLELVGEEVSFFIFNAKPKILNPLLIPFIIQTWNSYRLLPQSEYIYSMHAKMPKQSGQNF